MLLRMIIYGREMIASILLVCIEVLYFQKVPPSVETSFFGIFKKKQQLSCFQYSNIWNIYSTKNAGSHFFLNIQKNSNSVVFSTVLYIKSYSTKNAGSPGCRKVWKMDPRWHRSPPGMEAICNLCCTVSGTVRLTENCKSLTSIYNLIW